MPRLCQGCKADLNNEHCHCPSEKTAKQFTVILLRPDYIADEYGTDIYIALVTANSMRQAVIIAREEVFKADLENHALPESPEDYQHLLIFSGHHNPVGFSWSILNP